MCEVRRSGAGASLQTQLASFGTTGGLGGAAEETEVDGGHRHGWAPAGCGLGDVSELGREHDTSGLQGRLAACTVSSGVAGAPSCSDIDTREPELNEATLFVGDLAKEVNEVDLRQAFAEHGTVLSVDIKRDRRTRSSLGYGFVQYASRRSGASSPGPGGSVRGAGTSA